MNEEEKKELFKWLRPKLRRLSYQWPPRREVKVAARVSRGKYECVMCKEEGLEVLWGPKDISLDHICPIVPPETGFSSFDEFIENLFCEASGFQVLCKLHHDQKSHDENIIRKIEKDKKKLDKAK